MRVSTLALTITVRYDISLGLTLAVAVLACSEESATTAPPPPDPPPSAMVLLRDIDLSALPSPYYHFEYDTEGRLRVVAVASDLRRYDVIHDGDRITTLVNNTPGNRDRLEYSYDEAGRVDTISYVDPNGSVFARVTLFYDGQLPTGLERKRLIGSDFITDKVMGFVYVDGNLLELVEHHPAIAGRQDETTAIDRFEFYDNKLNVDGFSLLHTEFFDHLVLLPGVQLQKGNPGRETFTSEGLSYTVDYTYTYDDKDRPLTKSGDVTFTNGPDAGRKVRIRSTFSYY